VPRWHSYDGSRTGRDGAGDSCMLQAVSAMQFATHIVAGRARRGLRGRESSLRSQAAVVANPCMASNQADDALPSTPCASPCKCHTPGRCSATRVMRFATLGVGSYAFVPSGRKGKCVTGPELRGGHALLHARIEFAHALGHAPPRRGGGPSAGPCAHNIATMTHVIGGSDKAESCA
jgi:hypothetical protein